VAVAAGAVPLRVAVVGAGVFGRNHLRVYRELEQAGVAVQLAAVIEPNPEARARAEADFGVRGFAAIPECMAWARAELKWIGAASVCVPTVHHAACALELMACGIDLLIEKPIAATLDQADAILRTARELGRLVQVGHLERFNPPYMPCSHSSTGQCFLRSTASASSPRARSMSMSSSTS